MAEFMKNPVVVECAECKWYLSCFVSSNGNDFRYHLEQKNYQFNLGMMERNRAELFFEYYLTIKWRQIYVNFFSDCTVTGTGVESYIEETLKAKCANNGRI